MSSESFNSQLLTNSTIPNNTDNNQPEIESDFIFGDGQDESIVEESTITPTKEIESDFIFGEDNIESVDTKQDAVIFGDGKQDKDYAKVSNLEKLEYGWDKNQMVFGNALRLVSNSVEALFDPDRDLQDVAVQNEADRIKKFEKEHWKMLDGSNDGAYTMVGEAASFMLDPYYITGYWLGKGMLATPLTSMTLNAALMGGDSIIEQLAKKGTVDFKEAGKSAAIGGGVGLIFPIGGKVVTKLFPSLTKGRAEQVSKYIDDKIANANGLTTPELNTIKSVANSSSVKNITNKMDELVSSTSWNSTSKNIAAPINKAAKDFSDLKTKLSKQAFEIGKSRRESKDLISKLTPEKKFTFGVGKSESVIKVTQEKIKSDSKKILDIRNQIRQAKVAYEKQHQLIVKRQYERANKYYKLEGERTTKILEELAKSEGLGTKFLKAVLANLTRPLVGAATGAAANITSGAMGFDVEDDFGTWASVGFALGAGQKAIQKSIKMPLAQKNAYSKVIENHAVQYTFQKLRELTAGTLATKLNSFGGTTQKIGRLLFRQVDDPLAEKSVIAQVDSMNTYFIRKANNLIKASTPEQQAQAISIVRGNQQLEKVASKEVLDLANNLKGWMDEFKNLYNKAGFYSPKELENYFPRVLNFDVINADRAGAEKIFTQIFKNNYKMTTDKARTSARNYLDKNEGPGYSSVINQNAWDKIIQGTNKGIARTKNLKTNEDELIFTPISDHITKHRSLQGKFDLVEDILEKNNFLVNDLSVILPKIVQDSTKSIAFARTFGKGGQLLKPMLEEIKRKYDDLALKNNKIGLTTRIDAAKHETNLVLDAVDAYFDRLHKGWSQGRRFSTTTGILTMMSNLSMLGRVTISSLGDIVQPFQNSQSWTAAVKGLARTNLFKATWEKGLARNLNYDITNEMSKSIQRTAAAKEKDLVLSQAWMGKWGAKDIVKPEFYNNIAFKGLGLEWLTGYARRFAYNTGSADAYNLSRQYFKVVNSTKGAGSQAAKTIERDLLLTYNIRPNQALLIGKANTFNKSIQNSTSKKFLNQAGLIGSNRDALIPQVSNRLLFTQSKEPMVRMLGQFLSWSQAKSSQTNKILQRIENGNVRTLIKTVAALPVYAGIQQLREYAKHGDVITDAEYNTGELVAKSWQLSGMPGWLSDLVFNRFVGPGATKENPFYVFAPALNIATEIGLVTKEFLTGKPDDAKERINRKLLPFPEWRRWVQKFWFPKTTNLKSLSGTSTPSFAAGGIIERKKFNKGDYATSDMGYMSTINEIKKDLQEKPTVIKTNEQLIDEVPNQNLGIKIPKKKPSVEQQVNNIMPSKSMRVDTTTGEGANILPINETKVKKDYSKISDLEPAKKQWLFDTAQKVYTINKDEIIPSDIILAINSGETGWGSSRFFKEGSNNLFNFQSFDDKEESIDAKESKAKIKKFKTPEDSIIQFLDWVQTKPNYEVVRKEMKLYNEGKSSKENIIKAIAKTGFAEDKEWSSKITSILNNRIDGKHKQELKNLTENLFKDKEKFNIGGFVAKTVSKQLKKALDKKPVDKVADDLIDRGKTAITNTAGTYKKVNKIFDDNKINNVHDFGSGIGIGTRQFKNKKVTSHEPFVPDEKILKSKIKFDGELFKGRLPDYRSVDDVIFSEGFGSKDGVVNANVLNVIEDQVERESVVKQIAQLISDKGMAIITTRGAEVAKVAEEAIKNKSKSVMRYGDGYLLGKGTASQTFQKGFGKDELLKYIQDILGKGFKVEKIPTKYKIGSSGVIIRKNK